MMPGMGSLAGIHSALHHSNTPFIFIAACDMPLLNGKLIRKMVEVKENFDIDLTTPLKIQEKEQETIEEKESEADKLYRLYLQKKWEREQQLRGSDRNRCSPARGRTAALAW